MKLNRQSCSVLLCFLWINFCGFCQNENSDTIQLKDVFYRLLEEGNATRLIDEIRESPDDYEPPVLFAMANKLFLSGQKEEAVFWFYLAQVRSLYTKHLAESYLQETAQNKIDLYLSNFGSEIKPYALSQPQLLARLMGEIEAYLNQNKENYNLLWLYSKEEELPNFAKEHFKPKEEWKTIRHMTYQSFFKSVGAVLKKK